MDFKKKSRPFFIIIFKLKNGNFKTRDFSPLIERVLAGVIKKCFLSRMNASMDYWCKKQRASTNRLSNLTFTVIQGRNQGSNQWVGIICPPPLVEIGLTDLSIAVAAMAPPAPLAPTSLPPCL